MKSQFSDEYKKKFVQLVEEENISIREAAKRMEVSKSQAHRWWQIYCHRGLTGLETIYRKYGRDFKISAVKYTYENNYTINETAQILGISDTSLYKWIERYEALGVEGLIDMRKMNSGHPKDALKKQEDFSKKDRKALEDEVIKLKAEVDYLKKYNALVQEKNQRTKKKAEY